MEFGYMPARSIRIFLVRHCQSETNLAKKINTRLPDHRVELSRDGIKQAVEAGEYLARTLERGRPIGIFCSPYVRARQTSAMVEKALEASGVEFEGREAKELREIQFGLFDGIRR
jgi:broad specificity phosphatase PhoE